jgi:hypothetical protein
MSRDIDRARGELTRAKVLRDQRRRERDTVDMAEAVPHTIPTPGRRRTP